MTELAVTPATVAEINAAHRACEGAAFGALEHACRAGELLAEAKRALPHGAWLPWVREHCEFSARTAQIYQRVAARWPELNTQRVAHLSLRRAAGMLSDSRPGSGSSLEELRAAHAALRPPPVDGLEAIGWANEASAVSLRVREAARERCDRIFEEPASGTGVAELIAWGGLLAADDELLEDAIAAYRRGHAEIMRRPEFYASLEPALREKVDGWAAAQ